MTKWAFSTKMVKMKRLFPLVLMGLGLLLLAGTAGFWSYTYKIQSGELIVWLAADPERAEETLTQILKFYP